MQANYIQALEQEFKGKLDQFPAFKKASKQWDEEKNQSRDFDEFPALSWDDIYKFVNAKKENFSGKKNLPESDFKIDFQDYQTCELLNILLTGDASTQELDEKEKQLKKKGFIFVYANQVWMWKRMVQSAIDCELPLLALATIYQADGYFQDKEKKYGEFYVVEKNASGKMVPKVKDGDIISDLRSGKFEPKVFASCRTVLSENCWMRPSPQFQEFFSTLSAHIAKMTEMVSPVSKAIAEPKPQSREVKPEGATVTTAEIPKKAAFMDAALIPEELMFISHLGVPEFIGGFLQLYQSKQFQEAERYAREMSRVAQGQLSMRALFLARILRLYCLFHIDPDKGKPEQRIVPTLESLWLQLFQLQADLNLEKPEGIMLARWEPPMYAHLVILTLKYSQEINKNQGFQVNNKQLSEEMLRRHLASIDWI